MSLGEYPLIRYYRPAHHPPLGPLTLPTKAPAQPTTEGSGRWRGALSRDTKPDTFQGDQLCQLLAMMVQEELDEYKKANPDYPPPSQRPQAVMFITDRSMDVMAPFLHEFTYQAMCNDLLKIEDGAKYKLSCQAFFPVDWWLTKCSGTSSRLPEEFSRTRWRHCPTRTPFGQKSDICTCEKRSINS